MAARTAKTPPERGFQIIGAPRFELGTSSPPDQRANQAAPRPSCGTLAHRLIYRRADPPLSRFG